MMQRNADIGREPWSSGYGRRLTYKRPWVRIPAPDTGWRFFRKNRNKKKDGSVIVRHNKSILLERQ